MLQPNELRIGNAILIEIFPAPPQWHFVKAKDILDIADGRITIESISGIPITPEVLERCGFEFKPTGEEVFEQIWKIDNFEIWQHDEGFCHNYANGGDVHSLHQLQNLYFALTGQELKISEK